MFKTSLILAIANKNLGHLKESSPVSDKKYCNVVCSTDNGFSTMTNVTVVKSLGRHWIMAASLDRAQCLMKMFKFMTSAQDFGSRILQSYVSENYCANSSQSRKFLLESGFLQNAVV